MALVAAVRQPQERHQQSQRPAPLRIEQLQILMLRSARRFAIIYDNPANAFVYRFLGDVNLFHGRSDGPSEYARPSELEVTKPPGPRRLRVF